MMHVIPPLCSFTLFSRDHTLASKRLDISGRPARAFSLARTPSLLPCPQHYRGVSLLGTMGPSWGTNFMSRIGKHVCIVGLNDIPQKLKWDIYYFQNPKVNKNQKGTTGNQELQRAYTGKYRPQEQVQTQDGYWDRDDTPGERSLKSPGKVKLNTKHMGTKIK